MKILNIKSKNMYLKTIWILIIIFNIDYYVQGKPKLDTQKDVANYVNIITDFNSIKGIQYSFKKIGITDDNTLYLHEKMKGTINVWLVEVKNFRLKLNKANPDLKDQYNRNFKILIDPNNGVLLKMSSKYEGNDPDVGAEHSASKAIGEKDLGFPDTSPNISFIDALDIVSDFGIGMPYYAKEMDARYLWYSLLDQKPQRVWVIHLRGIPAIPAPDPPGAPPANIRQINHIRYIINTDTGKILTCDNYPG